MLSDMIKASISELWIGEVQVVDIGQDSPSYLCKLFLEFGLEFVACFEKYSQ
jgi:hypothetical protein